MNLLSVTKPEKHPSSVGNKMKERKVKVDLLDLANTILIIGSIGVFVFTGYKAYIFNEKGMPLPGVVERGVLGKKAFDIIEDKKTISYYEGVVRNRNIFQALWDQDKEETVQKAEKIEELNKTIKLMGVLLDDDPTAIIEDIKKQKTLFMSIGDQINGAVLFQIQEGKVIFLQNSDSIEIIQ